MLIIFGFQGTFDIKAALVNNDSQGTLIVNCTFATNSQALGCLVVLHPWNTTQTETFAYAARSNTSAPAADTSISRVPKGNHTMLVFDGEHNGLLSEQAALAAQNVTITKEGGLNEVEGNNYFSNAWYK